MPIKRVLIAVAIFAGCGSSNGLPVQPQIEVSPAGLLFGTDLCLGTWIGTAPQNDLQILNGGQDPLTITAVTMAAPGVFQMTGPNMILPDGGFQTGLPMTIQSQQTAFLQVIFQPTAVQKYEGTITVSSNAQNEPALAVPLRGVRVADPVDGGYVVVDAGITPDCTGDAG